jgi:monothiol glutaredoxin
MLQYIAQSLLKSSSLPAWSSSRLLQSCSMATSFRRTYVVGAYSSSSLGSVSCVGQSLLKYPTTTTSTQSKIQLQGLRCMNSDSHDDFGPVKKSIPSNNKKDVHDMIQDHITKNSVMLYMKGNPQQPMCGFSATVTKILQSYNVDFSSVNVLDYPTLRDGIKTFSNWPTIPQLYINGEFIGGCDIVKTMHENGELKELLDTLSPTSGSKETN